jgi:hypothetical protein
MDRPAATGREIILEIVRNMREGLEPLQYSTLAPSVYNVYLHVDDLERLRGILPRIVDEARRARYGTRIHEPRHPGRADQDYPP